MALVQRSCGYALRPTLRIDEIERAVQVIKAQRLDVIVAVDNCYGEFTDSREPPSVSAEPLSQLPPARGLAGSWRARKHALTLAPAASHTHPPFPPAATAIPFHSCRSAQTSAWAR